MLVQALLADHAQVEGGKLFISGGGITLIGTPSVTPPHPVSLALAVIVQVPWTATNQPHNLTIELVHDDAVGDDRRFPLAHELPPGHDAADMGKIVAQFNVGRPPGAVAGEDSLMPLAVPLHGVPLPGVGGYYFAIEIDGTEVSRLSFRVVPPTNVSMFQA